VKIGFVLQPDDDVEDILRWACRQIEKAYQSHSCIWVKGEDADLATINALLWTYELGSFVPHLHLLVGETLPASHVEITPIVLSQLLPNGFQPTVIINLSTKIYTGNNFDTEIIELVSNLPVLKEVGRAKFKGYRQAGFSPLMMES
jgi:DNA polymerase-3 subunit chi